jgi:hypothetical protein
MALSHAVSIRSWPSLPHSSDPAPTSKTKKKSAQPSARTGRPEFAAPLGAQPPTDKEHDPASLKCQSAHTPETPGRAVAIGLLAKPTA